MSDQLDVPFRDLCLAFDLAKLVELRVSEVEVGLRHYTQLVNGSYDF